MFFDALGRAGPAGGEIVDRVFYARHDTRTPVLAAVLAVGVNVVASLVLMRIDFRGLALANSIAALVEAGGVLPVVVRAGPGPCVGGPAAPARRRFPPTPGAGF